MITKIRIVASFTKCRVGSATQSDWTSASTGAIIYFQRSLSLQIKSIVAIDFFEINGPSAGRTPVTVASSLDYHTHYTEYHT